MRATPLFFLFVLLGLTASVSALAGEKRFDNFTVHYSVFNSAFISADVAKAYGITRGKNRALINIAVRTDLPEGGDRAQRAVVSGSTYDLIHRTALEFREIEEQGAIYYIAEFTFTDKELRSFTLSVQPQDADATAYELKFNQTFYVDE